MTDTRTETFLDVATRDSATKKNPSAMRRLKVCWITRCSTGK